MESEKALELAKWLRGWVVEGVPTSVIAKRLDVFADEAREEGRRAALLDAIGWCAVERRDDGTAQRIESHLVDALAITPDKEGT